MLFVLNLLNVHSTSKTKLNYKKQQQKNNKDSLFIQTFLSLCLGPPSPGNLRATQITWAVVSLEWDEIPCLERSANIDEYRIFGYRGNDILRTASSQDTIHTATGLRPDTEYSFFVYAVYYDENNRGPYQGGHSTTLTLFTQSKYYKVYIVLKCSVYISESWTVSYYKN